MLLAVSCPCRLESAAGTVHVCEPAGWTIHAQGIDCSCLCTASRVLPICTASRVLPICSSSPCPSGASFSRVLKSPEKCTSWPAGAGAGSILQEAKQMKYSFFVLFAITNQVLPVQGPCLGCSFCQQHQQRSSP